MAEGQGQARAAAAKGQLDSSMADKLKQALPSRIKKEKRQAEDWLGGVLDDIFEGSETTVFDRNVTKSIENRIAAIDEALSAQLAAVMHDDRFQKLEGTWRGLKYLTDQSQTGPDLKVRMVQRHQERPRQGDQGQRALADRHVQAPA